MKFNTSIAIFLIALCAIDTWARAENVYRCGSSYSQQPCPEGVQVDVQDARTAAQKAESDAVIRRDSNTANAMERERLQKEARLQAANAKAAARSKKTVSAPTPSPKKKKRRQHQKR